MVWLISNQNREHPMECEKDHAPTDLETYESGGAREDNDGNHNVNE
jgi:hypothetical protein